MRIIDNKKDYYDYLSGVYGIDDLIVYDRRGSVPINTDCTSIKGAEYFFCQELLPLDKPIKLKSHWQLESIAKRRLTESDRHPCCEFWGEGDVYHFILEVGHTHYRFEIERWIDDKTPERLHVETTLMDTLKDVKKRYSNVPICIISCRIPYWWRDRDIRW